MLTFLLETEIVTSFKFSSLLMDKLSYPTTVLTKSPLKEIFLFPLTINELLREWKILLSKPAISVNSKAFKSGSTNAPPNDLL